MSNSNRMTQKSNQNGITGRSDNFIALLPKRSNNSNADTGSSNISTINNDEDFMNKDRRR